MNIGHYTWNNSRVSPEMDDPLAAKQLQEPVSGNLLRAATARSTKSKELAQATMNEVAGLLRVERDNRNKIVKHVQVLVAGSSSRYEYLNNLLKIIETKDDEIDDLVKCLEETKAIYEKAVKHIVVLEGELAGLRLNLERECITPRLQMTNRTDNAGGVVPEGWHVHENATTSDEFDSVGSDGRGSETGMESDEGEAGMDFPRIMVVAGPVPRPTPPSLVVQDGDTMGAATNADLMHATYAPVNEPVPPAPVDEPRYTVDQIADIVAQFTGVGVDDLNASLTINQTNLTKLAKKVCTHVQGADGLETTNDVFYAAYAICIRTLTGPLGQASWATLCTHFGVDVNANDCGALVLQAFFNRYHRTN